MPNRNRKNSRVGSMATNAMNNNEVLQELLDQRAKCELEIKVLNMHLTNLNKLIRNIQQIQSPSIEMATEGFVR